MFLLCHRVFYLSFLRCSTVPIVVELSLNNGLEPDAVWFDADIIGHARHASEKSLASLPPGSLKKKERIKEHLIQASTAIENRAARRSFRRTGRCRPPFD
jgi:hypothetical protein